MMGFMGVLWSFMFNSPRDTYCPQMGTLQNYPTNVVFFITTTKNNKQFYLLAGLYRFFYYLYGEIND